MSQSARSLHTLLLAAMVVCAISGPASAQPPTNASKKALAQKLFKQAEKHYNLGRFQKALTLYSKAYETLPLPGFLFNIGQCHRMMGHYTKALFFYQGYLRATDAPNRLVVEKLIVQCKTKATEQARIDRRKAEAARRQAEKRRALAAAVSKPPAQRRVPTRHRLGPGAFMPGPTKQHAKKHRPWFKTWWFWTAVGVGTAALVGGIAGGLASKDSDGTSLPSGSLGRLDRR